MPPVQAHNPASPEAAAAYVLELALADPSLSPAQALERHRQQVRELMDPSKPAALEVLSRQLPVLEALWQRFAAESLRARTNADRAMLLRVALHAQGAHARTFALLHALAGPAPKVVAVDIGESDGEDKA